jgi:hypothetical protein
MANNNIVANPQENDSHCGHCSVSKYFVKMLVVTREVSGISDVSQIPLDLTR